MRKEVDEVKEAIAQAMAKGKAEIAPNEKAVVWAIQELLDEDAKTEGNKFATSQPVSLANFAIEKKAGTRRADKIRNKDKYVIIGDYQVSLVKRGKAIPKVVYGASGPRVVYEKGWTIIAIPRCV